jgi:AcrR family transcriptional regulator
MNEKWKNSLEYHRNDKREEIIDAALQLFLEKELSNVTMTDIVAKAGISRVTLYKYFKSIHEIAFEIQIEVLQEMIQVLDRTMATGKSGAEKLQLLFEAMLDFFDERTNYLRFMSLFDYYYRNTYPTPGLEEKYNHFLIEEVRDFFPIREGIKDGSLRSDLDERIVVYMVGNTFLGIGQRMAMWGHLLSKELNVDPKEVLQQVFDMIYEFLKPRPYINEVSG